MIRRRDNASGDHKLHRILDRHFHEDHVLTGAEQQKTRCRVRCGRHKYVHHVDIDTPRHLTLCSARHKTDHPQIAPRIFDEHHLAKGVRLCRDHRLQNLLAGPIDGPHDRHSVENGFAKPDDPATEEPGRDGTDQRDQQHADDQPYAGHIGKAKLVKSGKNAGHLTVNQLNGPPGDVDGKQYRSCNQKAGEKPGTQTAENTGTLCLLGSVFLDHQGSSRRRVAALIMVRNMNWRKGVCRHHLHFKGRHFGPCQCCASVAPVVCQWCASVVPVSCLAACWQSRQNAASPSRTGSPSRIIIP